MSTHESKYKLNLDPQEMQIAYISKEGYFIINK